MFANDSSMISPENTIIHPCKLYIDMGNPPLGAYLPGEMGSVHGDLWVYRRNNQAFFHGSNANVLPILIESLLLPQRWFCQRIALISKMTRFNPRLWQPKPKTWRWETGSLNASWGLKDIIQFVDKVLVWFSFVRRWRRISELSTQISTVLHW